MNGETSTVHETTVRSQSRLMLIKTSIALVVTTAALFLSAGTLDWPMAWVWVVLVVANFVVNALITDPELQAERAGVSKGAKRWDIPLVLIVARLGPLAILIVAGLDQRHGWSPVLGLTPKVVAVVVAVLGAALTDWAMVVNRFFAPVVRIQQDRGHTVVSAGPYAWMRHPGYAGSILFFVATSLMLESLWSLVPTALTVLVVVVRTALEDRTLRQELEGYEEYARQVRHRLVPGIW